jgi:hypothetical protein
MAEAQAAQCPVTHIGDNYRPFDHEGTYEIFAQARATEPVFYSPELDAWVLTRRADVLAVFKDTETFSSSNANTPIRPLPPNVVATLAAHGFGREPIMFGADDPRHSRVRKVVSQYLNPQQFRRYEPQIRELTREYIDRMRGHDVVDIVDALTYELPARVVQLLIGAPADDVRKVKTWASNGGRVMWGRVPDDEAQAAADLLVEYWQYCEKIVAEHQENPDLDDYPGFLLRARNGNDAVLDMTEVHSIVFGLLFAGHETTSHALSNLIFELLRNPGQWDALVADPSEIKVAVEEGLRYVPPFITTRRRATRDTEINGVPIRKGATLLLAMASANRDEATNEDSETFDIAHPGARKHLSFGYGAHFCLGAPLARLEMLVVLEELVAAFPQLSLVPDQKLEWPDSTSFRGPTSLLVRLTSAR